MKTKQLYEEMLESQGEYETDEIESFYEWRERAKGEKELDEEDLHKEISKIIDDSNSKNDDLLTFINKLYKE